MNNKLKKIISSFFYIGYIPFASGTFASAAALAIYIITRNNFLLTLFIQIIILALGFILAGTSAKLFNRQDPSQIVIDEVNGMLLCFIALPQVVVGSLEDKIILGSGFVIYRIFDIFKPYPANRLQRLSGSVGIMGDDIVAAIYTNLILRILLSF